MLSIFLLACFKFDSPRNLTMITVYKGFVRADFFVNILYADGNLNIPAAGSNATGSNATTAGPTAAPATTAAPPPPPPTYPPGTQDP